MRLSGPHPSTDRGDSLEIPKTKAKQPPTSVPKPKANIVADAIFDIAEPSSILRAERRGLLPIRERIGFSRLLAILPQALAERK